MADANNPNPTPGFGYQVQPGDSLRKIAKTVYGDEMKWKQIWEANKDQIPNPDRIKEGTQLSMPPRES